MEYMQSNSWRMAFNAVVPGSIVDSP